jgi:hypothetical protein
MSTKSTIDAAAAANAFATLVGWLPSIASLLSIIWLCIQMWTWWKNQKAQPK